MVAVTVVRAPEYATEAVARKEITEGLQELGFKVETYGLKDKNGMRTVTVTAEPMADEECQVERVLKAVLAEHGYNLGDLKLSISAERDVSGQQQMRFDQSPSEPAKS